MTVLPTLNNILPNRDALSCEAGIKSCARACGQRWAGCARRETLELTGRRVEENGQASGFAAVVCQTGTF